MNKHKVTKKGNESGKDQIMARRGTEHKEEKRDKLIRVRTTTYNDLVALGRSMLDDFDDIISRLIDEHKGRKHRD